MIDSVKGDFISRLRKEFSIANDKEVTEKLTEKIDEAESANRLLLLKEDPFGEHDTALKAAQATFDAGNFGTPYIQNHFDSYSSLAKQTDARVEPFWRRKIDEIEKTELTTKQLEISANKLSSKFGKVKIHTNKTNKTGKKTKENTKTLHGLLLEYYQKLLDTERAKWEMEKIAEYRRRLFEELEEWLRLLQQLSDVMNQLSLSPGRLFDLSKDGLSFSDIEEMKRWAEYLSQDEGAQKLCEMLGRMRATARVKREEWIRTSEVVREVRLDIHSREEIIGVCAGDSIEYALAEEKTLLADEDTSILFYLKFAEKRLMQFEMQGMSEFETVIQKDELTEVTEEEKMGPMIVCVDTSGSMHGTPENIAKAVTLHMATKAASQNRDCYLINFSTGIEEMDLSGYVSLPKLIEFLRRSFHGGTDVAPAVTRALEIMQKENYKKADLLIISDFLMDRLPKETHTNALSAKENGNKFYSLTVGEASGKRMLGDLFEHEWTYNPRTGGIRELLNFTNKVAAE